MGTSGAPSGAYVRSLSEVNRARVLAGQYVVPSVHRQAIIEGVIPPGTPQPTVDHGYEGGPVSGASDKDCSRGGGIHRVGENGDCACGAWKRAAERPPLPAGYEGGPLSGAVVFTELPPERSPDGLEATFTMGVELPTPRRAGHDGDAPAAWISAGDLDPGRAPGRDPNAAPRYCTETWDDPEGDTQHCTSVLSDGLNCTVCSSRRCYAHCGSVDHFERPAELEEGGRGNLAWKVVKVGGVYHGHVAIPGLVICRLTNRERDPIMRDIAKALRGPRQPTPKPERGPFADLGAGGPFADVGQGEPDADLPASDRGPGARARIEGAALIDRRHTPALEFLIKMAIAAVEGMPTRTLDAMSAVLLTRSQAAPRAIEKFMADSSVDRAVATAELLALARGIVADALDCGCDDCAPIRQFGHLARRGVRR